MCQCRPVSSRSTNNDYLNYTHHRCVDPPLNRLHYENYLFIQHPLFPPLDIHGGDYSQNLRTILCPGQTINQTGTIRNNGAAVTAAIHRPTPECSGKAGEQEEEEQGTDTDNVVANRTMAT